MIHKNIYVYKVNNGFKFRLRVPKELKAFFDNKTEITKSIKVSNIKEALKVSRVYLLEYEKLCVSLKINYQDKALHKDLIYRYFNEVLKIPVKGQDTNNTIEIIDYSNVIDKFIGYLKSSKDENDKNLKEIINFFDELFRYITKDFTLTLVDVDDVTTIKQKLQNVPKRTKQPFKSMTIDELMNQTHIDNKDRISTSTLKKYIKWIRRFYRFTYASRFIDVDIASFIDSPKAELSSQMEREPFEVEEVKKSFKIIEDVLTDDNLKLVYKILAYTGMRISELSKGKLKQDGEIFYIDLTEESCSLKTKSSHRKIPLHKDLILLDVQKKYNHLRGLFKDEYISKKFREQVKPHLTNNPRKTLYSYRHTLATQLKYAEVNPIVISELMGHSHEGMTMGRYASRYPIEVLKEAIDKLEF
ncbi:tyrosine-type recombinase/integrase [Aliarcobacter skirrowii]|uniref:tyrosine-type recombinase/integrase n=1 Tax=Aliarcobacter skirrowii TaxID=28200 RepID=UPI0029B70B5D|nr:tyrosine-type recombinase/integrase [Aliarcobacter skirrowii]MDX4062698.1 tyrosine-type recombinase/integrase [Aliarcobacter skirrowii]